MSEQRINNGDIIKHFKRSLINIYSSKPNNYLYKVLFTDVHHSETDERMVVYQALYEPFKICVRPYDMFMSEVDQEKYPHVSQKYRFEKVDESDVDWSVVNI